MTERSGAAWRISIEPEGVPPIPRRSGELESAERTNDPAGLSPVQGGEKLTLSVPEAANLLGISRALAYELVARGELPSMRLGHRIVVPRRALLSMVEGLP